MIFSGDRRLQWTRRKFEPELTGTATSHPAAAERPLLNLHVDPTVARLLLEESTIWVEFVLGEPWKWYMARVTAIDASTGVLATDLACDRLSAETDVRRIRFLNTDGKIAPGECVLVPGSNRIVFRPQDDAISGPGDCALCVNPAPLVQMAGASGVRIENLLLRGGLAAGIHIEDSSSIVIKNCTFRDLGFAGIDATGTGIRILDCDISDVGTSGIRLTSGEPRTLAPGGSEIRGCHVQRWSQWKPVYEPAIRLRGVGSIVDDCVVEHGPHMAIEISGNDHVICRSHFADVVREFADMGAIYVNDGLHPLMRGNRVEGNIFQQIGGRNEMNHAVYSDNWTCGLTVRRNLFIGIGPASKTSAAVYANGPSWLAVTQNLFVDCAIPLDVQFFFADWAAPLLPEYEAAREAALIALAADGFAHLAAYPELRSIGNESIVYPSSNRFVGNAIWNPSQPMSHGPWRIAFGPASLVETSDNAVFTGEPGIVGAAAGPLAAIVSGKTTAAALAAIATTVVNWREFCRQRRLVDI